MKTVITLSVLQLIVILFLLLKVMDIDEQPGQAMTPVENNVAAVQSSNSPNAVEVRKPRVNLTRFHGGICTLCRPPDYATS